MSWETSDTMREFMRIAKDKDLLGLKKQAMPAPNPYQEDLKTIENKRLKTPEKHIMEEAHPKSVYVAESRGDGGLVENELEHQQKIIEMINKYPTGSLVGRYANAIDNLVKLANTCDELGHMDAAEILTDALEQFVSDIADNKFPLA